MNVTKQTKIRSSNLGQFKQKEMTVDKTVEILVDDESKAGKTESQ